MEYDDVIVHELQIKSYEDKDTVLFTRGFLNIGNRDGTQGFRVYISHDDIKNKILNSNMEGIEEEYKVGFSNIVLCLNAMYKTEQYNQTWERLLPENKKELKGIMGFLNEGMPTGKDKMLNRITKINRDALEILLDVNEDSCKNSFFKTIEGLDMYIDSSPFTLFCSVETMQDLARDYIYIKNLRNMTNHANDESIVSSEIHQYFEEYNYKTMEAITLKEIGDMLKESVDKIRVAITNNQVKYNNFAVENKQKMEEIQSALHQSKKTPEEILAFLLEDNK